MKFRVFVIVLVSFCLTVPLFAQGPPEHSGPNVERWEFYGGDFNYWFLITDSKRNYVALVGVDAEAACVGDPDAEWGEWSIQDVYLPPGEALMHSDVKGDEIPTSVYPIEFLDFPDICAAVLGTDPIATGWTDVIVTDNDVYAWYEEFHPRTNAYHLSAHGMLSSFVDGEKMMFSGGFNCQWPGYPEDPATTEKCKEKIVLN